MTNRYAWVDSLRELGHAAKQQGDYELGEALLELARLVLTEQEKQALDMLRAVPTRD